MKDKNGVEINVGDIVEFFDELHPEPSTIGIVLFVSLNAIQAFWEDTQMTQHVFDHKQLTVIKPAAPIQAEQPTGFTQEDEAMLQMLLKRKQDHEDKHNYTVHQFEEMVRDLDDQVTYNEMSDYLKVKINAEKLINVLKGYHKIN